MWYRYTRRYDSQWIVVWNTFSKRFQSLFHHREVSYKRWVCLQHVRRYVVDRAQDLYRAIHARNVADRREIKPACSVNWCCSARNEFLVQFIRACRNRLPRSRCPRSHNEVRIFQRDFNAMFLCAISARTFSRQLQIHAWENKRRQNFS